MGTPKVLAARVSIMSTREGLSFWTLEECRKVKVDRYNYSAAYGDPKGIVRQRTWG
jgi:hypothetical protein